MEFKTNPKLVGNRFHKIVYSTPEVEERGWPKSLVTMYLTTWRPFRENIKFQILLNESTLTWKYCVGLKESPVPWIGVEEERGRGRLCSASVSVLHHSSGNARISLSGY